MKKKESENEWKADDSAPISSKGRKKADYRNQTTNATGNRFPWTTVIIVVVILTIVGGMLLM